MKIILIGNKGQVGREIEELGAANGIEIVGCDVDEVDITNFSQLHAWMSMANAADLVINAAAYTAVDEAEDEPDRAYAVNRDGVKNLALVCKEHAMPLLHLSTDYVFSGTTAEPYTEDADPQPLNVYGSSKLAGDEVLQQTLEQHLILRVSWVFGRYGNNFVKTMLRLLQQREVLRVVDDQRGCPTAAADIARVLLELAVKIKSGKKIWGIYNYCGYPATTWYGFTEKIVEVARSKYPLRMQQLHRTTTAEYPTKARRPLNSELVVAKIERDYGVVRQEWLGYLRQVIEGVEL